MMLVALWPLNEQLIAHDEAYVNDDRIPFQYKAGNGLSDPVW